jgi:hypothetical protein
LSNTLTNLSRIPVAGNKICCSNPANRPPA